MAHKPSVDAGPIPLVDLRAEYAQIGDSVISAISSVCKSGAFILGPQVESLETLLASYVQFSHPDPPVHCIGVSDGTTALQLCLQALSIGPGDEVITVPFTWISTAEVISLVRAVPVFVDINKETFLLDPGRLEEAVTENTKAVIVVSLFGLMPDFSALRKVLNKAEHRFGTSIALIEDGAQSFGAERLGSRSCGAMECLLSTTSFFPTKPLACYGDGGAVFTRDERLAGIVRALRVHGKADGKHSLVGVNGRLDTLQAAVLLTKFEHFNEILQARRDVAKRYEELLEDDSRVVLPTYKSVQEAEGKVKSAYGVYTIRVKRRDEVQARLKAAGIGCAVYYKTCCHQQPVFKDSKPDGGLEVAESLSKDVLSLPIHPYLGKEDQIRIARELRTALDDLEVMGPPE